MLGNFWCSFFFRINIIRKNSFRNTLCQMVWIQIRTNVLLGLIWVQTVCKGYLQLAKISASKELINYLFCFHMSNCIHYYIMLENKTFLKEYVFRLVHIIPPPLPPPSPLIKSSPYEAKSPLHNHNRSLYAQKQLSGNYIFSYHTFFCLFLIWFFTAQSTIFQLWWDGWVTFGGIIT